VAKVRVYELAKELNVESKAVMAKLQEFGEFVRSASSTIEAPVVRKLRESFPDAVAPEAAAPPAAEALSSSSSKESVVLSPSSDEVSESAPENWSAAPPLLPLRLFLLARAAAFFFASVAARFLDRVALARAAVRALRRAVYSALVSFSTAKSYVLAIVSLEFARGKGRKTYFYHENA